MRGAVDISRRYYELLNVCVNLFLVNFISPLILQSGGSIYEIEKKPSRNVAKRIGDYHSVH
jgi:hypothetical protein